MAPRLTLVSALLLCLILHHAVAISLASIFGTRVTKEDGTKDPAKEDVLDVTTHSQDKEEGDKEHDHHHKPHEPHKPHRPPLIFNIPHPADHPLHPHNRPHHPLHPDNIHHLPHLELPHLELPHLPHLELPHLPHLHHHFNRETIYATKTVFVEVTDKVTVHPVCMTVSKDTPACLPHHHHHHQHHEREGEEDEGVQNRQSEQGVAIKPTAAPVFIAPTATAEAGEYLNLEPTRIFGGEFISEPSPLSSEASADSLELELEDTTDARVGERDGRWVRLTPPIKEEPVKVKDDQPHEDEPAPAENSGHAEHHHHHHESPLHLVQHLIHRTHTHYKTKTLWVTKVEKVLDTRVTATMIAKNCVPVNSHIPFCEHHEEHHEGHHEYHGAGFLQVLGGVLAGGLTNKVDGEKPGDDQEVEETQEAQAIVVEAPEVEAAEPVKLQNVESQVVAVETTEREVEVEEDKLHEASSASDQTVE